MHVVPKAAALVIGALVLAVYVAVYVLDGLVQGEGDIVPRVCLVAASHQDRLRLLDLWSLVLWRHLVVVRVARGQDQHQHVERRHLEPRSSCE
jgi:hypothetical protein